MIERMLGSRRITNIESDEAATYTHTTRMQELNMILIWWMSMTSNLTSINKAMLDYVTSSGSGACNRHVVCIRLSHSRPIPFTILCYHRHSQNHWNYRTVRVSYCRTRLSCIEIWRTPVTVQRLWRLGTYEILWIYLDVSFNRTETAKRIELFVIDVSGTVEY